MKMITLHLPQQKFTRPLETSMKTTHQQVLQSRENEWIPRNRNLEGNSTWLNIGEALFRATQRNLTENTLWNQNKSEIRDS